MESLERESIERENLEREILERESLEMEILERESLERESVERECLEGDCPEWGGWEQWSTPCETNSVMPPNCGPGQKIRERPCLNRAMGECPNCRNTKKNKKCPDRDTEKSACEDYPCRKY